MEPVITYSNPRRGSGRLSGSLARGLHLLVTLASARRPLGLSELASRAGLDKTTTFRLAATLVDFGCISQDEQTRQYWLDIGVLNLGFGYLARVDVRERALPYMQALCREFGESVSLLVRDGAEAVYIERVRTDHLNLNVEIHIGARIPLYCTAPGKVLLADLRPEQRSSILQSRPLQAWTPYTPTDLATVEEQIATVRDRGYAISDQETVLGLRGLATPVRGSDGSTIAALNMSTSVVRTSLPDLERRIAPSFLNAAAAISAQFRAEPVVAERGARDHPAT